MNTRLFELLLRAVSPPRRSLQLIALVCFGLLGFGLYLQHVVGLEPCPMCIVQRYVMAIMLLLALLLATASRQGAHSLGLVLMLPLGSFGAFVAARQSWLQWYPPEMYSCGRDFYGMIETFPLKRAIPMIFRGSGDCTRVDWTYLGLSIANWSFMVFVAMTIYAGWVLLRVIRRRYRSAAMA